MTPAQILRARGKLGPYPAAVPERATQGELDSAAVRAWAIEHGLDVAAKGKLPTSVTEAYRQRKEE